MRCFYTKLRSMNPQVLFRLFRIKTTQSTTAITSIVASLCSQNKAKPKFLYPILRIVIRCTNQILFFVILSEAKNLKISK
ncbi:hypothetical protein ACWIUD_05430 [Helicobacter sp. 23-1044]